MRTLETIQNTNIIYLEADINYTIFHLSDGRKIVSAFTLKKYEKCYEEFDFLRINKSFLLNPASIIKVEHQGKCTKIVLRNGSEINVSRRKKYLVKNY